MAEHRTVRTPTDDEYDELRRMKRQEVGRVAVRAHIILLSARGHSAQEIADIHNVTDPMVYKWMTRFDEEGPEGLFDRERPGRPRKIDEEVEEEIMRILEGTPIDEGYDATRWTAGRIASHLENELDVDVHPETVRKALKRLNFSWTRPRRSLPEDPDFDERMREIDEVIANAGAETTLLFEDETTLKRFPVLRRMWQPVGGQREVDVPKQNGSFALYGALDVLTGETITQAYEKGHSDYTVMFLDLIEAQTEGRVVLFWDHATWHTSKQVQRWLDEHERIEVMLLPKRSPRTNPMEDLWRILKNLIAACLERSLDTLKASCRAFFDALSPTRALQITGLAD
jgi:transposase